MMTAVDMLSTIGSGQKGTGVYRIVVTSLLALLTVTGGLLSWFVKDEIQTFRDSVSALSATVSSHVNADVEARNNSSQSIGSIDIRLTRVEQSREDISRQFATGQSERAAEMQTISQTLVGVERELSVIEGHLQGMDAIRNAPHE